MNLEALSDVEEKMSKDIDNIRIFSRNKVELMTVPLNEIYKLFNYYKKFEKIIKDFQNINWKEIDEKVAENFIKSLSFIFDITKKSNPISYAVFYSMQYEFWQIVVIGGLFTNKPLSAKLLKNSLSLFGKESSDLVLEGDEIKKILMESEVFKNKLKQLMYKYGKDTEEFVIDEMSSAEDTSISFDRSDLLYALHNATLHVKAMKDESNKWTLKVEIKDTYDFTDFKSINEYVDNQDEKIDDIIATTLNNFAIVSSQYGVIKVYDVEIKFEVVEDEI